MLLMLVGCGSEDESASTAPSAKLVSKTFTIEGMHCTGCAQSIEAAVGNVEGVQSAAVSFDDKQAVVQCTPQVSDDQIIAAVTATGYKAAVQ
jgi:copper chaperone CopZ